MTSYEFLILYMRFTYLQKPLDSSSLSRVSLNKLEGTRKIKMFFVYIYQWSTYLSLLCQNSAWCLTLLCMAQNCIMHNLKFPVHSIRCSYLLVCSRHQFLCRRNYLKLCSRNLLSKWFSFHGTIMKFIF